MPRFATVILLTTVIIAVVYIGLCTATTQLENTCADNADNLTTEAVDHTTEHNSAHHNATIKTKDTSVVGVLKYFGRLFYLVNPFEYMFPNHDTSMVRYGYLEFVDS